MTRAARPAALLRTPGVLALLLLGTSCAAIAAAEANKRFPAVVAEGVLTPARPAADKFGADPTRVCPIGGAYGEIESRLAAAVKDRGANEVPLDGRLCAVAEAMLDWPSDEVPPHLRAFLGRYFGLPAGPPQVLMVAIDTDDPRQIGEKMSESIQAFGAQATGPRYGLAVRLLAGKRGGDRAIESEGKTKSRVVLVYYSEPAVVEPLPRRLELGQKAAVVGKLQGDLENPKLVISDAKGQVTSVEPPPGKAFQAEVRCDDKPGQIYVEIRADDMGNERVVESIPVACALDLPRSVAVAPPPAWPADAGAQEQKIVEAVQAERVRAGLKPYNVSPAVSKLARDLAEAMRDGSKKGATVAPINISLRLSEADIIAPVATQNPAAAPSAEVAHGLLSSNSGARANLMSTEFSDFGVGVAIGQDAQGKPMTWVIEFFVKVQPPPDVEAAKKTIVEAIARKRVEEKMGALTSDPVLEKLARDYAAVVAAAGGPPPKAKTEEFTKTLNKTHRDIVFMVDSRIDLADFAEDPNALAQGKALGLGAALGRHPRLGKNTLFVVMIIANPKAGPKK